MLQQVPLPHAHHTWHVSQAIGKCSAIVLEKVVGVKITALLRRGHFFVPWWCLFAQVLCDQDHTCLIFGASWPQVPQLQHQHAAKRLHVAMHGHTFKVYYQCLCCVHFDCIHLVSLCAWLSHGRTSLFSMCVTTCMDKHANRNPFKQSQFGLR